MFSGSGESYGFGKSSRNAENPNPRNEKRKKLGRGQERILESAEKEIEKAYEERGEGREGHSARVFYRRLSPVLLKIQFNSISQNGRDSPSHFALAPPSLALVFHISNICSSGILP